MKNKLLAAKSVKFWGAILRLESMQNYEASQKWWGKFIGSVDMECPMPHDMEYIGEHKCIYGDCDIQLQYININSLTLCQEKNFLQKSIEFFKFGT